MKTKLFLVLMLIFSLSEILMAQAPSSFKYQAVVRGADNEPLENGNVSFRIFLTNNGAPGGIVYGETHSVTTTDLGVADFPIGGGTVVMGNFSTLDWSNITYHLIVEMDVNGGSNFVNMGTSQLLSVPYALHAATAENGTVWDGTGNIHYSGGDVSIGTTTPYAKLNIEDDTHVLRPHIHLVETGLDFARISYANTSQPGKFWTTAGLTQTNDEDAFFNFYYYDGTSGSDLLHLTGEGLLGLNTTNLESFQMRINHGLRGLNLQRETTNNHWEFYTSLSGAGGANLNLYANFLFRGAFDKTDGMYSAVSDKSIKTNIRPLESLLGKIKLLQPSRYQYIDGNPDNSESIGFIAQDLKKYFPELVTVNTDPDRDTGIHSIKYAGLGIIAIKAIQEQQELIDTQTETITAQEAKINDLEARMVRLESIIQENGNK